MAYVGNSPTSVPLSSADILDSAITTAKIANGAVTIADLSATGTASSSTFLRGDNAWASAGATAGQVIQVVTATDSTQRSTTSTSFVTGSNTLSLTITPASSSNKIFIIVTGEAWGSGQQTNYTIYRGATNLGTSSGFTESRLDWSTLAMSYLDSPATTSATIYQVYFKTNGSTGYLNNLNLSSITAFEIKG
jgi:hypothetical protein